MEATQTTTATAPEAGCSAAEPQPQHAWLHRMIGQWICEGEASMEPGKPATKWTSTETVRSIGNLWIIGESLGEMPGGGEAKTMITLGYDPAKGHFVGSFVGSMMTNMWVYEGELDTNGNVLTLNTTGPGMSPGAGVAKYKDVMELKSDDHRTLTSLVQGEDGQWHQVMSVVYRRKI